MYNFNISPVVKAIIIANAVVWFGLVLMLQGMFLDKNYVFYFLGLTPTKVFLDFWLWQPFTYFFLHSEGVFHILFNMFALWMFGCELERLWGGRFFLTYYLFCGLATGLIYTLSLAVGMLFFNVSVSSLVIPMVGASGAIFGVLFAYGLIFSERVVYFMMVFPLKARYFSLLIAFIAFVSLVNSGTGSSVSHLAHLSGFASGFLFLQSRKLFQKINRQGLKKWSRGLKVVRNDDTKDETFH